MPEPSPPQPSLTDQRYSVTIILLDGQQHVVEFRRHAYNNLMELIVNELYENIGDCKGHAWCGTCHVEIVSGTLREEMHRDETMTLDKLSNTVATSRLACQIMTDELIDAMVFRVLGDI
ncbi:MAG: 2Fe-2S iron-sulfur cluster-binding protein [Novipirellula sp. JB048]